MSPFGNSDLLFDCAKNIGKRNLMKIYDLIFEPYISQEEVGRQTRRVAELISARYNNCEQKPLVLVTLGGAAIFGADLVRELDFTTEIAFVKCSSYHGTSSTGSVNFELNPTIDPAGRDVVIVEDIVDTGATYRALHDYLKMRGAEQVIMATMLFKEQAYIETLPVHYVALESENIFVVGSGLDYHQLGRNLKGIWRTVE
ncbi:Hypoxanthine-guanine phosphoribosyltransferase [Mucinivorans hirudinis]|uniref:Hypoxanthine-guanine phosphoribosyltransferase n=1 Tax=Mucinivorans hirudinis TaxID=1433126 RepID=A0A060RCX6_9BACT|nr:Hypoxanthine-guanine phosphoribosyltransferase [Mucinivorans hirudinis]